MGMPSILRSPPPSSGGGPVAASPAGECAPEVADAPGVAGRSARVRYPESAAQQSPGPQTSTMGRPAVPEMYRMSENPGGLAMSDLTPGVLPAGAYTMCVSGSKPPPGQFVAVPTVIAPSMPLTSPSIGGLNGVSAQRYRLALSTASARSAGVKSIRSSGTLKKLRA